MSKATSPNEAPLSARELELIDAWWRAANYLSVGQIYLLDNPLLKRPLELKEPDEMILAWEMLKSK